MFPIVGRCVYNGCRFDSDCATYQCSNSRCTYKYTPAYTYTYSYRNYPMYYWAIFGSIIGFYVLVKLISFCCCDTPTTRTVVHQTPTALVVEEKSGKAGWQSKGVINPEYEHAPELPLKVKI